MSTTFLPVSRRRWISSPDMSRSELLFFRLMERLSVGRAGCVLNFATLAKMLERCERQAWTLFGRLVRSGWIAYRTYRKGGKSYFEFWPLVRISERSQLVFEQRTRLVREPSEASSSAQKTALESALSTPKNCTPADGPFKTLLTAKQEDNKQTSSPESPEPCPVAVSILKEICPDSEALQLAREASRQKLTEDQIKRVIAAYRGQLANIRNRGAWLTEALRRGYAPSAPPSDHPSDNNGRQVRVTAAPPGWELPGEGHGAPKTRAARVSSSASPAPSMAPSGSIPREIPPMASAGAHGGNEVPRGLAQLRATIEALKASASAAS